MTTDLTKHRVVAVERVVATSTAELRETVLGLHQAFGRKSEADGTPSTMRGNWARLFAQMDEDGSGRLDYDEFCTAVAALNVVVSPADLDALWAAPSFAARA